MIEQVQYLQTIIRMLHAKRADLGLISLKENQQIDELNYESQLESIVVKRGLNCATDYVQSQILIDDFKQFLISINYFD